MECTDGVMATAKLTVVVQFEKPTQSRAVPARTGAACPGSDIQTDRAKTHPLLSRGSDAL